MAAKSSSKAKAAAPAADKHAGHVTLDSIAWDEAKGAARPYRLCSCGAKRPVEG